MPKANRYKSFVKSGKGLGLAKELHGLYDLAGYRPMPIQESGGIRSGRHPAGTLVFSVVDESNKNRPRFPGNVVIYPDGEVLFEGDDDGIRELQSVLKA
jgi:hypothetical protein